MLHIGLAIALLIVCCSYKNVQTLGKRTAIKTMTIILTVLTSLKLITFAGVAYTFLDIGDTSNDFINFLSSFTYVIYVIYYGLLIVLGVIGCIFGYKALANDAMTAAAYADRQASVNNTVRVIYTNTDNADRHEQVHFSTAETQPKQCQSCGKYNEPNSKFCVFCGCSMYKQ